MKYLINFVLTCVLTSFAVAQEDWPRWRGADLSDHSPDKGLLKKWPKDGPKQVWLYKDAGIGYSGPAISNGKFITMGERNGAIHVIAIDTKNGKEIWNAGGRINYFFGNFITLKKLGNSLNLSLTILRLFSII